MLNDYDKAYNYCLQAAEYINSDVELYYYSALNLIFEKQNKTECLKNTQEIIKILKNNQKSKLVNYMNISNYNTQIRVITNEIKFNNLIIYFIKKAIRRSADKELQGDLLSCISEFYYEEKKYYRAIGYGKIALKYLNNKEKIKETLDYIASSYYFISEFKKSIENYEKLIEFKNIDIAKICMQIAYCQKELGEIRKMKENVKKAYLIGSNDKEVQESINKVYEDLEIR